MNNRKTEKEKQKKKNRNSQYNRQCDSITPHSITSHFPPTLNPDATTFDQIFGLPHVDAQSSSEGGNVLQFHHRLTFAHVVLAALERYFEFEAAAGGGATTVVVAVVVVAMHQCLQHLLRHRPARLESG